MIPLSKLGLGLAAVLAAAGTLPAQTTESPPAPTLDPTTLQWPRFFATYRYAFAIENYEL
jgi:hypothetical protein